MVALCTVWYNIVCVHKALKMLPALAAGVSETPWSMEDLGRIMDEVAPKPGPCGPDKTGPEAV